MDQRMDWATIASLAFGSTEINVQPPGLFILATKHGYLENKPFIDDVPIQISI